VSSDTLIPRILHQTWLGADPLPEDMARCVETWRVHHPEWEHHLWTDENLPPGLLRAEGYERLRHPVERSDILRLELVHRYGGVYVDTDVECLRPIDPLLAGVTFFVERLPSGRLSHFVMGATPEHPVLRDAIVAMKPREFFGYDKHASGPDYVATFITNDIDVTIFPTKTFDPRTPAEQRAAYAIHHEAGTWKEVAHMKRHRNMTMRRLEHTQADLETLQQRHRETLAQLEAARARASGRSGKALAADAKVLAVAAPRRFREAARAMKRKLRAAAGS
jgi:mannosyltransferase OCH1-like enzyme